mmetsp:Transcript_28880/g.72256  ORF Transcript_28880/g.72256 Transcript_28880/m.72256 type:complete len:275 (+) Transcript_28880:440-1264(+)
MPAGSAHSWRSSIHVRLYLPFRSESCWLLDVERPEPSTTTTPQPRGFEPGATPSSSSPPPPSSPAPPSPLPSSSLPSSSLTFALPLRPVLSDHVSTLCAATSPVPWSCQCFMSDGSACPHDQLCAMLWRNARRAAADAGARTAAAVPSPPPAATAAAAASASVPLPTSAPIPIPMPMPPSSGGSTFSTTNDTPPPAPSLPAAASQESGWTRPGDAFFAASLHQLSTVVSDTHSLWMSSRSAAAAAISTGLGTRPPRAHAAASALCRPAMTSSST